MTKTSENTYTVSYHGMKDEFTCGKGGIVGNCKIGYEGTGDKLLFGRKPM